MPGLFRGQGKFVGVRSIIVRDVLVSNYRSETDILWWRGSRSECGTSLCVYRLTRLKFSLFVFWVSFIFM